jgi:type IV secretion system protein VirD4
MLNRSDCLSAVDGPRRDRFQLGSVGLIQYFGSRDRRTAENFSNLCGVMTYPEHLISNTITQIVKGATSSQTISYNVVQRQLVYPDELMVFKADAALLLVENLYPITARKLRWFNDPLRKSLRWNLQAQQ